jgi:hypothetical protein
MKSEVDEVTIKRAWGDLKCQLKLNIRMNSLFSDTVNKIKRKAMSEMTK